MSKRSKRWRKRLKKTARSVISVGAKVSRVARPLVSFAAGVLYGPAAAAVVTAASHYPHQWQETVRARKYGASGADARREGRVHAQRTTQHSLYAGAGGATTALLVGGVGAGATGLLGQSQLGVGSGAGVIPGVSNPFVGAPAPSAIQGAQLGANLGIQAAAPAKVGAAAGVQLGAGAGLAAAAPSLVAPASSSLLSNLSTVATGAKTAADLYEKLRAKVPTESLPEWARDLPGFPGGGDGGDGEGGLGGRKDATPSGTSDFATLALLLGGAYLVSKAA